MRNYKYFILKYKLNYYFYRILTVIYTFLISIKVVKTLECSHCGKSYYKLPKYCSDCGKRLWGKK